MVSVLSPQLMAAGAAWIDGPGVGHWITERLAPFGMTVGSNVPLGYASYAIVPIPVRDDPALDGDLAVLDGMLDVLGPFAGEQPVHSGIWDGWDFWYATGTDPRSGTGVWVAYPENEPRPPQHELDRQLAKGRAWAAKRRVEVPDAAPLELPHRRYYVWTGPLRSALAFREQPHAPPSLIWPDDRSWFVGTPIYTNEIAIGGTTDVIDAVLADRALNARRATPDDVLDIDD